MLTKYIEFKNAMIYKDDFIDIKDSLINQRNLLYEDMFLANYPNLGMCLDIGWYNGFVNKGSFLISLIKNENWDEPVIKIRIKTIEELVVNINAVLSFIDVLER